MCVRACVRTKVQHDRYVQIVFLWMLWKLRTLAHSPHPPALPQPPSVHRQGPPPGSSCREPGSGQCKPSPCCLSLTHPTAQEITVNSMAAFFSPFFFTSPHHVPAPAAVAPTKVCGAACARVCIAASLRSGRRRRMWLL